MENNNIVLNYDTVKILFIGAYKTRKTILLNKFIDLRNNPNKNSKKNNVYNKTESARSFKISLNLDNENKLNNDIQKYQDVEFIDCPGTDYYETINKIIEKFSTWKDVPDSVKHNFNNEINKLQEKASENIRNLFNQLNSNLMINKFDIYVIFFDYCNMWTFNEAML